VIKFLGEILYNAAPLLKTNTNSFLVFLSSEAARLVALRENDGGQAFYKIVKRCGTILWGAPLE
jgi:hypothetical protein